MRGVPRAEPWMEFAACRGAEPSAFFPPSTVSQNFLRKKFCDKCPAQKACLEYALDHRIEHGLWGGASERERRRILRERRRKGEGVP